MVELDSVFEPVLGPVTAELLTLTTTVAIVTPSLVDAVMLISVSSTEADTDAVTLLASIDSVNGDDDEEATGTCGVVADEIESDDAYEADTCEVVEIPKGK